MPITPVNIGTAPNNGTGDALRLAFQKLNASDAYLKTYADNLLQGLKWKNKVDAATTGNITLSGEQTIDGVTTSASRVLVKDQTDASENGIYLTDAGAWTRTTDADSGTELVNATVSVNTINANEDKNWTCNLSSITLGVTDIEFVPFTAGDGVDQGTFDAAITIINNSLAEKADADHTHTADDVTETATKLFVSPTEKNTWNAKETPAGAQAYADAAVADLEVSVDQNTDDIADHELRITDLEDNPGGSGGHIIEDEDVALPQRARLNFKGGGVTATDDEGNDETVVTIPGNTINITSTTGWADYADSTYTTGSPFTIPSNTKVSLPNDGVNGVRSEMPLDITDFYDSATGKILGYNGDAFGLTLEFKVRPTSNVSNIRVKTTIDIGGAVGEIYPRDFSLTKGSGNEHFYLSSFSYYTLNTFQANGGILKVEAVNSEVEIYDIRYVFTRIHKAGNQYAQNNSLTVDMLAANINSNNPSALNPYATINDLNSFTNISENQYGTHPAFTNQNDLNAYLLSGYPQPVMSVSNITQIGFDSTTAEP